MVPRDEGGEHAGMSAAFEAGSRFQDREFEGLDLADRHLVEQEFEDCSFVSCRLERSLWDRCRFVTCDFRSCDLSMAEPRDSSLRGVRFRDSRLVGVDWTRAETTLGLDVTFERSILDGGSFMELGLRGLRMIECRCEGTSFVGADLTGSEFTGTDLRESRFTGANLTCADFTGTSNLRFDPRECRMKRTKLPLEAALALLGELGVVVPELG